MKLRSGWPLALFVVLLVAVPILEVYVLVQVGQRIGVWWTVLILVAEAVLGSWLLRREGARAWRARAPRRAEPALLLPRPRRRAAAGVRAPGRPGARPRGAVSLR
ncbi:FxsA family protein, partial [Listeria monocytogenes]|uniref:FxsA family protein n=1 Tax=Listeria monocytogenes TaxID=1639 RepID=UPI001B38568F|nr:FxsA family protein [Listeria monocytogenes]